MSSSSKNKIMVEQLNVLRTHHPGKLLLPGCCYASIFYFAIGSNILSINNISVAFFFSVISFERKIGERGRESTE